MGTLSLNRTNRLFWLGRYLERAYTGLKAVKGITDAFVDGREANYGEFCAKLGIPDVYSSTEDFCARFCFDVENPNSAAAALGYAYDNAIVLRETLSTDALAYIQLAMNAMEKAGRSSAPGIELQWVLDDIMAFRGAVEEFVQDDEARNVIKTGTSLERVDLYLRLDRPEEQLRKEFAWLCSRLYKTTLTPDKDKMDLLVDALLDSEGNAYSKAELLTAVEGLLPVV